MLSSPICFAAFVATTDSAYFFLELSILWTSDGHNLLNSDNQPNNVEVSGSSS